MTPKIAKIFVLTTIVLLAIGMPGGAFAQVKTGPGAPSWLEVTKVTVKPEKAWEFGKFMKDEFKPALVKGGVKLSYAWQTAIFGDEFTYYFVSPIAKFADYDGDGPIEKALGKDGVGPFYAKASALVTSVHTTAMIERPDLTYMSKDAGQPKLAVMIGINVNQGHEADFENFMINEYLPALRKSDAIAFLAHQTVFGGDQNEYVMIGMISNFAELDKGHPISRLLGRDGFKKLMQKMPAGTISESEINIIRLNETLSIIPGPADNKM